MKIGQLLAIAATMAMLACSPPEQTTSKHFPGLAVDARLAAHSDIFAPGVEKVVDGVYVAIGFGLANAVMIEGRDGVIIVDTMESTDAATRVLQAFRRVSDKPVKAIIYTHNHADHVCGAQVFAAAGESPDIYAHALTDQRFKAIVNKTRPIIGTRSMRMFGNFLDREAQVNAGIGPFLDISAHSRAGYLAPTVTFEGTLTAEVAGVQFELVHAPGETDDQLFVWLPDRRVLLCGDNFYWAFPNLYTIRGTRFRGLQDWYRSLDKIRDLRPRYLVPGHSRPLRSAATIQSVLTDYRDAIQYVHDQSIRMINSGYTPDELAAHLQLPPHLAEKPYLQPFYGDPAWSARAMFSGHLGWFDGDAANLNPLPPQAEAELIARLAGGSEALRQHARQAFEAREYQAVLQLTGYLLQLEPNHFGDREMRVAALIKRAETATNPNARHWYLTEAAEIRDRFVAHPQARLTVESLQAMPLSGFFDLLAVSLDPERSARVNRRVGILFPAAGEAFGIHVRYGVAEIRPLSVAAFDEREFDIKLTAEARAWKAMLARERSPWRTLPFFRYEKGNTLQFARFLKMFQPPEQKLPVEPARTRTQSSRLAAHGRQS